MCTSLKTRCACAQSLHSCLTLCDPRTVAHQAALSMGILQARILEWVAMPSSRGSSWPRDPTCASCVSGIVGWFFTTEPLSPWGAYLFRKDVTASCYCSVFIQVTHLLNRPGFQSSVCGTQLDPSLWVFRMPLTCGCITKQSTVKFKVTGQGSWWSKVNISIVFSDTEAEFEERETGKP